ncbi:hypothetical protein JW899_00820 [Candidatus Uhrbacteria bacterium]|nr:hypothetical protein [Candidatus Uhrbacteria bacterium]
MKRLTKNLAAFGLTVALCLPLAAMAVSPVSGDAGGNAVRLAQQGDLGDITSNFEKVGTSSGLSGSASRDLPTIIGAIINAFLGLLGIVLVVIIIFAGYKWMMARGNTKDVDDAKTMILNAVIGMVILMAAYAIAQFVLKAVAKGTTGTDF